ncbi:Response regulator protein TmoT [Labrenzia sp. THAF191b]|uniref:response regulator transcription factor n=1 Tax=unclassified Labrenzia TaxID=2648686 RepID=UPI001268191F|nr:MULTISPECIES: response regulator [unclassified Labrenzia]QFS96562.1 Response regulator protein TmoT [Labrenzia sp. THAF191b]QFT02877.1 Response regulator protein TmoT [Labrenzia sp. THAF191a]QFT14419.1 Response regulator protein TmoT [Labrenzia sp. THAF187b]
MTFEAACVAVIDDDESLRNAISSLLRSVGMRVSTFATADLFLNRAVLGDTDLIITDIHMPGMSGIELKDRLDDLDCQVPVIMITAKTEQNLLDRAEASGAYSVFRKPFDTDDLLNTIEQALAD